MERFGVSGLPIIHFGGRQEPAANVLFLVSLGSQIIKSILERMLVYPMQKLLPFFCSILCIGFCCIIVDLF